MTEPTTKSLSIAELSSLLGFTPQQLIDVLIMTRTNAVEIQQFDKKAGLHSLRQFFGTEEHGTSISERLGSCYELAALALGNAALPGSFLVHGSMYGPDAEQRIGHAWVVLPGDFAVWEPISAGIYHAKTWYDYAKAWAERSYAPTVAARLLKDHGHYGRWHESRYP